MTRNTGYGALAKGRGGARISAQRGSSTPVSSSRNPSAAARGLAPHLLNSTSRTDSFSVQRGPRKTGGGRPGGKPQPQQGRGITTPLDVDIPTLTLDADMLHLMSGKPGGKNASLSNLTPYDVFALGLVAGGVDPDTALATAVDMDQLSFWATYGIPGVGFGTLVRAWKALFADVSRLAASMVARPQSIATVLSSLAGALTSNNYDLALWSCRILSRIGHDLGQGGKASRDRAATWMVHAEDGGLPKIAAALGSHPDIKMAVFPVLDAYVRHMYSALFSKHLPATFAPLQMVQFMHDYLPTIVSVPASSEAFQSSGAIKSLRAAALGVAETPPPMGTIGGHDARAAALALLSEVWAAFPAAFEADKTAGDRALSVLKKAARDPDEGVALAAHAALFELLDAFAASRSPQAAPVYKTLVFSMIENHGIGENAFHEFIVANMGDILNARPNIPVGIIVPPLLKHMDIAGFSNLDFDFFLVLARHPRLSFEQALPFMNRMALIARSDLIMGRAATIPLLVMLKRYASEPGGQKIGTWITVKTLSELGDDTSGPNAGLLTKLRLELVAKIVHLAIPTLTQHVAPVLHWFVLQRGLKSFPGLRSLLRLVVDEKVAERPDKYKPEHTEISRAATLASLSETFQISPETPKSARGGSTRSPAMKRSSTPTLRGRSSTPVRSGGRGASKKRVSLNDTLDFEGESHHPAGRADRKGEAALINLAVSTGIPMGKRRASSLGNPPGARGKSQSRRSVGGRGGIGSRGRSAPAPRSKAGANKRRVHEGSTQELKALLEKRERDIAAAKAKHQAKLEAAKKQEEAAKAAREALSKKARLSRQAVLRGSPKIRPRGRKSVMKTVAASLPPMPKARTLEEIAREMLLDVVAGIVGDPLPSEVAAKAAAKALLEAEDSSKATAAATVGPRRMSFARPRTADMTLPGFENRRKGAVTAGLRSKSRSVPKPMGAAARAPAHGLVSSRRSEMILSYPHASRGVVKDIYALVDSLVTSVIDGSAKKRLAWGALKGKVHKAPPKKRTVPSKTPQDVREAIAARRARIAAEAAAAEKRERKRKAADRAAVERRREELAVELAAKAEEKKKADAEKKARAEREKRLAAEIEAEIEADEAEWRESQRAKLEAYKAQQAKQRAEERAKAKARRAAEREAAAAAAEEREARRVAKEAKLAEFRAARAEDRKRAEAEKRAKEEARREEARLWVIRKQEEAAAKAEALEAYRARKAAEKKAAEKSSLSRHGSNGSGVARRRGGRNSNGAQDTVSAAKRLAEAQGEAATKIQAVYRGHRTRAELAARGRETPNDPDGFGEEQGTKKKKKRGFFGKKKK